MKLKLKDLAQSPELVAPGHRACQGCGATLLARQIMLAAGPDTVVTCATGCLEVVTTIYPQTAWRVPFIHSAFENSAATMSGVEAAYRSLKRQKKIDKDIRFIAFGGDGGTYDIGLQALSGMAERGHRILYVCYDNEAYMNTGIQRSGATPMCADTTTAPVGEESRGKRQFSKDLTAIMIAHNIPYAAQASPSHWKDLITKVHKALDTDGPSFLNIMSPCPLGWRYDAADTIELARLAVDTCYWPLFEVKNGMKCITHAPKEKKPLIDFLKPQGRFKHLMNDECQCVIDEMQAEVDRRWEEIQMGCVEV
jgi:pyruvate ferredoxin oxidoreductase beta subunit